MADEREGKKPMQLNGDFWKLAVILGLATGGPSLVASWLGSSQGNSQTSMATASDEVSKEDVRMMIEAEHRLTDYRLEQIEKGVDEIKNLLEERKTD